MSSIQFMTAREQVEESHRLRGEPTYAELKEINAEMLAELKQIHESFDNFRMAFCEDNEEGYSITIDDENGPYCKHLKELIAKAEGQNK